MVQKYGIGKLAVKFPEENIFYINKVTEGILLLQGIKCFSFLNRLYYSKLQPSHKTITP